MRRAFAHDAVVVMPSGDDHAPGAAVTVELCGRWDHEPPCPLAPHHVATERHGDELRLRILFATEPGREADVRRRIAAALGRGELTGPDDVVSQWRLDAENASAIRDDEAEHAGRLMSH